MALTTVAVAQAVLTAGQASVTLPLAFTMLPGESWSVMVGTPGGDFYRSSKIFCDQQTVTPGAPFVGVGVRTDSDPVTLNADSTATLGSSAGYCRSFTLHGANTPKGVQGKLEPADYIRAGDSSSRSSSPVLGELFYDTTLAKLVVWNGSAWAVVGA